ncbi:hypothetical protein BDR07DRAFT_1463169 [Suillus spraguei]|nr:hypothetical protein BDR07DRAFT_1463169 [Suillus spraguei]
MRKGNSLCDSTQETHTSTSSQATARESSHQPRNKVRQFLGKFKDIVHNLRTSRSKDSHISPVPLNVHHERDSSTRNIEVDPLQPYTKMALGMLSFSAKIILAQVEYDTAVLKLLEKLGRTHECAYFIENFPEVKKLWSRLTRSVVSQTDDIINKYNDVFDRLMDFQDQHTYVVTHICAEKLLGLRDIAYARGAGLVSRKECLQGTRTEILSEITEWVNSTEDNIPCVLWLSGPAGKGK